MIYSHNLKAFQLSDEAIDHQLKMLGLVILPTFEEQIDLQTSSSTRFLIFCILQDHKQCKMHKTKLWSL